MEYTAREIATAISVLAFAFYGVYRLRKRRLNLIKVNSDHLVLWKLLLGEFIVYANEIVSMRVMPDDNILIKTNTMIYKVDDIQDPEEIISFCHNNKIDFHRESRKSN